jgi:uncharacterized protein RhaS with RHS repeats
VSRYTQSDPIGLAGGFNAYSYAETSPLNYVDADGRSAVHVAAFALGTYGGAMTAIADQAGQGVGFDWIGVGHAGLLGGVAGIVSPVNATTAALATIIGPTTALIAGRVTKGLKESSQGDEVSTCGAPR